MLGGIAWEAYRASHSVFATGRRPNFSFPLAAGDSYNPLDLANIPAKLDWPRFDQIVVCSGSGGQAFCEADPALARQINVDGVTEILSRIADVQTQVVLCSSDLALEDAKSQYGRQKYDLEKHVREKFPKSAILRLGKVLDQESFIGVKWRHRLDAGLPIDVRPELFFSPVQKSRVKRIFEQTANLPLQKTILVSANDEWSYETLAKWLRREDLSPILNNDRYVRRRSDVHLIEDAISTENTLTEFFKTVP